MRIQCSVFAFFIVVTAACAEPLEPELLMKFSRDTGATCMENQVKFSGNRSLNVGQIQDYCSCYAAEMTKAITREHFQDMDREGKVTTFFKPIADAAIERCVARFIAH